MPERSPPARRPRAVRKRRARLLAMARLGVSMMLHNRLKLAGTLSGVVLAVVLGVQQLSILLGLLHKNTMLVENAKADLWILPAGTQMLQAGGRLADSVLQRARATAGVMAAEPLLYGSVTLRKATGGTEPVTLIGTSLPGGLGGPWNLVAGSARALAQPDTVIVEDSERERYGGLNLGSELELNGYQVRVGGFTWGLLPYGPAYAFTEIDVARAIQKIPSDRMNFVLVALDDRSQLASVERALKERLPEVTVLSKREFSKSIVDQLLKQQLGMSFGISTLFGVSVGLMIVALSMFSSVVERLREFGTLKAIGCTGFDLAALLVTQSVVYAAFGSLVGLALIGRFCEAIRGPRLVPIIPNFIYAVVPGVMVLLCILAAGLAVRRVVKLEPGRVFQ